MHLNATEQKIADYVGKTNEPALVKDIAEILGDDNKTGKTSKQVKKMVNRGIIQRRGDGYVMAKDETTGDNHWEVTMGELIGTGIGKSDFMAHRGELIRLLDYLLPREYLIRKIQIEDDVFTDMTHRKHREEHVQNLLNILVKADLVKTQDGRYCLNKKYKDLADTAEYIPEFKKYDEFEMGELKCKFPDWTLKFKVLRELPRMNPNHNVLFRFNNGVFRKRLDEVRQAISDIDANPTLDPSYDAKQIKMKMDTRDAIYRELEETMEVCEDISFVGFVSEMKYTDDGTVVVFRLKADVINHINDVRSYIADYYKVDLYANSND